MVLRRARNEKEKEIGESKRTKKEREENTNLPQTIILKERTGKESKRSWGAKTKPTQSLI